MKFEKQWLEQGLNDSEMSLEDNLLELQEMPEYFISDLIFGKSYDEMNSEEKAEAYSRTETYIKEYFG